MTFPKFSLIVLSLASAVFSLGTASAGAITVNNPSFEILPSGGLPIPYPGNGHFSEAAIPDWTNFQSPGLSGQYAPGNIPGAEYNYLPDGVTFAYSNGGTISQTVGATVNVGDVYTLSVDLGNRSDLAGVGGTIDLLVGGTRYFGTGTPAAAGGWAVYTATYTGLLADAGDAITIELNNTNTIQADFDAVSLTDTPGGGAESAPEPGPIGLVAAGLGSLILAARSRRAQ